MRIRVEQSAVYFLHRCYLHFLEPDYHHNDQMQMSHSVALSNSIIEGLKEADE